MRQGRDNYPFAKDFTQEILKDEGDKGRTIYEGSWGGANAHIHNNTKKNYGAGACPSRLDSSRCAGGIHATQSRCRQASSSYRSVLQDWRFQVAQINGGSTKWALVGTLLGTISSLFLRLLYKLTTSARFFGNAEHIGIPRCYLLSCWL